MLIFKGNQVVNLANTFSLAIGGQGNRYVVARGSDHLQIDFVFENHDKAVMALEIITQNAGDGKPALYIDEALKAHEERITAARESLRQPAEVESE